MWYTKLLFFAEIQNTLCEKAQFSPTVLSFTAIFDSGCLIWWGLVAWVGMEESKKSGGGDVRAEALRRTTSGDKAVNSFSALSPLSPTVARLRATHIPRFPKKKPLRGKKVGFAEKNCAYSTYSIVFVDKWVNCLFGSFPHPFCGGGGRVPVCGFRSDLDQNRAVLWSKSEHESPEVTIQLCNNIIKI